MDIRPIGFAVWIASVAAVAACSPSGEDRIAADIETTMARDAAARAAAARQKQQDLAGPATGTGAVEAARPGAASTAAMGAAPAAAPASDAQITSRVKAEIAAARDLAGSRIDVDTRDGVVTLSGTVRTAAVKARAGEIARRVGDVRDVNDQLTLASG